MPAVVVGIAYITAVWVILVSLDHRQPWPVILGGFAIITVVIFLTLMLWLQLGISLGTAQLSSIVLAALIAFLLSGYIRRKRIAMAGICQGCKHRNEVTAHFCTNCGRMLGEKPRPIVGDCPRCNLRNSAEAWFCTRCGLQLRQVHSGPAGVCQYCQHKNEESAQFCVNCGRAL